MISYIDVTTKLALECIEKTIQQFIQHFNHQLHMSAFTQWIICELSKFSDHYFRAQVFVSDDKEVIAKCLNIITSRCKKLEDFGLCITFHLQQILMPYTGEIFMEETSRSR